MITRDIVFQPEMSIDLSPGATVLDLSRYKTDLTLAGTAVWTQEPSGLWVLTLDGNSDYASLNIARWRDEDFAGTIIGWIKSSDPTNNQTIFASSDTGTDVNFLQLRLVNTTGFLEIVQRDGGALNQITGDTPCVDGIWHHCAVTGDMAAGAWILYVDGIVQGLTVTSGANTGNWFSAIYDIRDNLSIGAILNTGIADYVLGSISLSFVSSYVFTAGQIRNHYEKTKHLFGVHT